MTFVVLPPPLHTALLPLVDIVDPPLRGVIFGAPDAVARLESIIPLTYARQSDGSCDDAPGGWTVRGYPLEDGEVDIPPGIAYLVITLPQCPPGLIEALQHLPDLPPQVFAR